MDVSGDGGGAQSGGEESQAAASAGAGDAVVGDAEGAVVAARVLPQKDDVIVAKGERWTVMATPTCVEPHTFTLRSEKTGRYSKELLRPRKADGTTSTSGNAWEWDWPSSDGVSGEDAARGGGTRPLPSPP